MELSTGVKIAFLLLCATHASSVLGKVSWWLRHDQRAVCTAASEIICSDDCSQVLVCLGDGSGGFYATVVAVCDSSADQKCSAEQAACVASADSECHSSLPGEDFTCHGIGSFPDPYDCQTYHICTEVNAGSQPESCSGTTAYNPLQADCSLTTSDRVCTEGPITPCTQLGQVGIVPENPAIYYICIQKGDGMSPEMYRCPGSQTFNVTTAACVDSSLKYMLP
ncbi:uncharacterized protein LOC124614050 [Schistocerca americana]|uniref:uncharacterized protein LOC124614050 n=1 Tax=Schistocerca americana TaxID=7009 RepID=UPI001F4F94F5|nr:uncharacterized protein LOC124614050 [Schistocerca americana]